MGEVGKFGSRVDGTGGRGLVASGWCEGKRGAFGRPEGVVGEMVSVDRPRKGLSSSLRTHPSIASFGLSNLHLA